MEKSILLPKTKLPYYSCSICRKGKNIWWLNTQFFNVWHKMRFSDFSRLTGISCIENQREEKKEVLDVRKEKEL